MKNLQEITNFLTTVLPKSIKQSISYVILLLALSLAFLAYSAIQNDRFREILLKKLDKQEVEILFHENSFASEMESLIVNLNAQSIVIWKIEIGGVTPNKRVIYALNNPRSEKVTNQWLGKAASIYSDDASRITMTYMLEGVVKCGEFIAFSQVGEEIQKDGDIKYFCVVPVPPVDDKMIGIVAAYFDHKPNLTRSLEIEMKSASEAIVIRR